jgi:hypothetical protein
MDELSGDKMGKEITQALYIKIKALSAPQKIYLALMGNFNARSVLIRHPNTVVKRCVLSNHRLTSGEIIEWSKDKNMDSLVIREIAQNGEWTKSYVIRLNLAMNPKVPIEYGLKFLASLNRKDIYKISKSKDVHPAVASSAKHKAATYQGN